MKKFTLVELLVVIAVIGILASLLLPSLKKAREKALLAVCVSNLSQINKANNMFMESNNDKFIDTADLKNTGIFVNTGYGYAGLGGSYNPGITRPLNVFLGVESSGSGTVNVALCPKAKATDDSVTNFGTSYMAAARDNYTNDLDGDSGISDSPSSGEIYHPSSMVLMANQGAWHWSLLFNSNVPWTVDTHEKHKYPISFVDGHVMPITISEQNTGISHSFDKLSFINIE